ncbi:MAG TPA: hypothetical protein VFG10_04235 [Saprospiraceae bacterium]|nr:hypothetical protein [Saprospiraceae bacterium]
MKITSLVILFIISFLPEISAQKFLLIERTGSPRTKRFAIYDEITFQLKDDDKGWYTRQILDLNADAQLILLGDAWIPISDISRFRMSNQRLIPTIIGGALQAGGVSMILGDLWYTLRGNPEYTEGGMEFGLINIAVGTGIRMLLGPIKYKLGKKTRLRVVDVTFGTIRT